MTTQTISKPVAVNTKHVPIWKQPGAIGFFDDEDMENVTDRALNRSGIEQGSSTKVESRKMMPGSGTIHFNMISGMAGQTTLNLAEKAISAIPGGITSVFGALGEALGDLAVNQVAGKSDKAASGTENKKKLTPAEQKKEQEKEQKKAKNEGMHRFVKERQRTTSSEIAQVSNKKNQDYLINMAGGAVSNDELVNAGYRKNELNASVASTIRTKREQQMKMQKEGNRNSSGPNARGEVSSILAASEGGSGSIGNISSTGGGSG